MLEHKLEVILQMLCSPDHANQILAIELAYSQLTKEDRSLLGEYWYSQINKGEKYKGSLSFPPYYSKLAVEQIQVIGMLSDSLERLELRNYTLDRLPATIGLLTNLKYLKITFSKLTELDEEVLGKLVNLEVLILDTKIQEFPTSFAKLKKLHTLEIKGSDLGSLQNIELLKNLRQLKIDDCMGIDWAVSFAALGKLKKLEILTLKKMKGYLITKEIGTMVSLKKLEIFSYVYDTDQFPEQLPESMGQLVNLEELTLHSVKFNELPQSFGNLKKLKTLILKRSTIKRLPVSFGKLKKLEYLDLSHAPLEEITGTLSLKELRQLDLSETRIKNVPESLKNSKKLETLLISRKTDSYHEPSLDIGFITELTALRRLTLRNLSLPELPSGIGKLSKLIYLNLRVNRLKAIPDEFEKFTELSELLLDNNAIHYFPNNLAMLDKLKQLSLNANRFKSVPVGIFTIPKLEVLNMTNNKIRELKWKRGQLKKLRELNLINNKLQTLPAEIRYLNALEMLIITENPLKSLPVDAILAMKGLKKIKFGYIHNKWEEYQAFRKALENKGVLTMFR